MEEKKDYVDELVEEMREAASSVNIIWDPDGDSYLDPELYGETSDSEGLDLSLEEIKALSSEKEA